MVDEPRVVNVSDTLSPPKELLGAQLSHPGVGGKSVRVTDGRGHSLSVDMRDDGAVYVQIKGKGIPGREDEVPTCDILMRRLNREERQWAEPEARPVGARENGVDVEAKRLDGGKPLQLQVTRVDPDPELWSALGSEGVAEKTYASVDAVADALQAAILKKLTRPQAGITLLLNGTQLPIGLPSVRESFEQRHGAWLRGLKFDEVWVVESFDDDSWTCRLFPKGGAVG
jgi:hypothetical protein